MRLEVRQRLEHFRPLEAAFLVGFGDHIQLLGTGEAVIHHAGGDVVIVVRVQDRRTGFGVADLDVGRRKDAGTHQDCRRCQYNFCPSGASHGS